MHSAEEITQINVQIQGIDDQIEKLRQQWTLLVGERTQLYTRLNSLQSITCSIPAEILSHIFHCLVAERTTPVAKTLLRIGAVCSRWRHTAWSSPQLWTKIQVLPGYHKSEESESRDVATLLRLFYKNSRGLPVDFTLNNWGYRWNPDTLQAEEIMETALKEHRDRLRYFTIYRLDATLSSALIEAACGDIQLPFLEEIFLSWIGSPEENDQRAVFCHAPRLSHLSINLCVAGDLPMPFSLIFPWGQLRALQLHGLYPSGALEILTNCPQLLEFDFSCAWLPALLGRRPEIPNPPLTLARLERLKWSVWVGPGTLEQSWGDDDDSSLLMNFRFPSLKELSWDGILDIVNRGDSEPFFACMESSIKVLRCPHPQQLSFESIFGKFDNVTELYLTDDSNYNDSDTLENLTVWSDIDWNPLPRLRVLDLTLDFGAGPVLDNDSIEHDVIRLLYSRRNAPVDWDDETEVYTLQPFDPTSDHWQRYCRLERFTLFYIDKELDWENSELSDELSQMVREASAVDFAKRLFYIAW